MGVLVLICYSEVIVNTLLTSTINTTSMMIDRLMPRDHIHIEMRYVHRVPISFFSVWIGLQLAIFDHLSDSKGLFCIALLFKL